MNYTYHAGDEIEIWFGLNTRPIKYMITDLENYDGKQQMVLQSLYPYETHPKIIMKNTESPSTTE